MTSRAAIAHQILVVDDESDTSDFLKDLLEQHGYKVILAKDGGQAHSAFTMHKPDFVILDLILPGESGFEICERMKAFDEAIPVLILTAIDMDDSRRLAQRVGADGYLTKPFDPNELLDNIVAISERLWEKTHLQKPRTGRERIRFTCRCGKRFKVSTSHRGKTLTCPECGEHLVVPTHA
ncbi:MAG: response regulator transcription factor [Planctomycetaceae bacterium]